MNRFLVPLAMAGAALLGWAIGSTIFSPAKDDNKRMDAALGRVFVVDNTEYVSARIYHVANHIICVGQNGKELILHVAAIENITKHTQEATK